MLLQAIADLQRGRVKDQQSATEWFEQEQSGALSFKTCCEILDRPAEEVRRVLLTGTEVPKTFRSFFDDAHQAGDAH